MTWSGIQKTAPAQSRRAGFGDDDPVEPADYPWIRRMIEDRQRDRARRDFVEAAASSSARTRPRSSNLNSEAHGARSVASTSQDLTAQQALNNAISQMSARSRLGEMFSNLAPASTAPGSSGGDSVASTTVSQAGSGTTLRRTPAFAFRNRPPVPPSEAGASGSRAPPTGLNWSSLFSRSVAPIHDEVTAATAGGARSRRQFALPRSQGAANATAANPSTLDILENRLAVAASNVKATRFASEWEVQATLTGLDLEAGTVTGVMRAMGVRDSPWSMRRRKKGQAPESTEQAQEVLTGFEGEVIDFGKRSFWSKTVPKEVDLEHWLQTPPFKKLSRSAAVVTFLDAAETKKASQDYVLMRWKGGRLLISLVRVSGY